MADVENPPTGQSPEATPLRPKRHVLMRRSTRVFVNREPKSGALVTTANLCCSLACSLLVIALFNVLSVVSIAIGAIYLSKENCPAQPNIAPVLIATGILAIFLSLLEGRGRVKVARNDGDGSEVPEAPPRDCLDWITSFVRTAKLALFIYFCIIVYSLYPKVKYERNVGFSEEELFCNPTLFLFSFWMITFVLVSIGLALTLCCCFCCCLAICVAADA